MDRMKLPSARRVAGKAWLIGMVASTLGCSSIEGLLGISGSDDGVDIADDVVAVAFRNLTTTDAVNVEFYATSDPLVALPDGLFLPGNLVSAHIGVAGTGIVRPLSNDVIEFPCDENLVIGTLGGTFSDDESGEFRGTGERRWAEAGPLGLCGNVVTFEFASEGGTFTTNVRVGW